jgi:hypothetical protein
MEPTPTLAERLYRTIEEAILERRTIVAREMQEQAEKDRKAREFRESHMARLVPEADALIESLPGRFQFAILRGIFSVDLHEDRDWVVSDDAMQELLAARCDALGVPWECKVEPIAESSRRAGVFTVYVPGHAPEHPTHTYRG